MKRQIASVLLIMTLSTSLVGGFNMVHTPSFAATQTLDMIDINDIVLDRGADGIYHITFKEAGTWEIYVSQDPNYFSDTPKLVTTKHKVALEGLNPRIRYFLKLVNPSKGQTLISERRIFMESDPNNTRDLGGYVTKDGRSVKWGMLYRSGSQHMFTDEDKAYFETLNLGTIVDFRSKEELEVYHTETPEGVNYVSVPIWNPDISKDEAFRILKTGDLESARKAFIAISEDSMPQYKVSFTKLFNILETTDQPLLYHCSAGKDRTGFATALLLHALGVDRETIVSDYLDSNKWRADFVTSFRANAKEQGWNQEAVDTLAYVTREKFDGLFKHVENKYGSVDNYLIEELDVDIAALRDKYLE